MSKEVWALLGVVVGGLLGGGAQVLAEWLRSRHDAGHWQRANQQQAFSAFLVALGGVAHPSKATRDTSVTALNEALAGVRLAAPRDTFDAALNTARSAWRMYNEELGRPTKSDEIRTSGPLNVTRQAFVELAKRDLGFED